MIGKVLNVTADDNRIDLDLALHAASYFGLSAGRAEEETKRILALIRRDWQVIASENGLSRAAIRSMEPAFSLCREMP